MQCKCLRYRPICVLALATFCPLIASVAFGQQEQKTEKAAKPIADAIRSAGMRKVLVLDFLDASGARTDKGVYFAASFARVLVKHASGFSLTDRWAWFSLLEKNAAVPADGEQPEGIQHICAAVGCDGVVAGRWRDVGDERKITLSLLSLTGVEHLTQVAYELKKRYLN